MDARLLLAEPLVLVEMETVIFVLDITVAEVPGVVRSGGEKMLLRLEDEVLLVVVLTGELKVDADAGEAVKVKTVKLLT